jgi:DNA topoisomerase-1
MKYLVIVESPSKIKTISKYLGEGYKITSSKGHIRDLATTGKYGLGVDIENDFEPTYVAIKGKKKVITDLKKEAKACDMVLLATDPDREGEAISWHLFDAMNLKEKDYERVVFNEITKDVILESFRHPRKIDMNLVKSQETRRILDRIIGFRLSKLMQSKTSGKSAGRVQSVALKLVVDREREIEAFKEEEYWLIEADFKDFKALLEKYRGKELEIKGEKEADDILAQLSKSFTIESTTKKEKKKASPLPFKTSTLQQVASNKLGFNSGKTMKLAQKLYEGVDLGSESVGLITYMRTDSTRMSSTFINDTFNYIKKKYGNSYIGYVKKGKKEENIQDAHEGIRITDISRDPESIKSYLSNDEYKLYKLIYSRSLASLMADAKMDATTIILDNNGYTFKATGSVLTFDGYLKVYSDYEQNEDVILPDFSGYKTNVIISESINKSQHFTKPLPRYTEATLIKEMEKLGIGRPSTYAKTMEILRERDYVNVLDKKFYPTITGIEITDKLQEFFSNIINVKYTAKMETELDEVAEAKFDSKVILKEFYQDFEPLVQKAFSNMEKKEPDKTGEVCPECGSDMVKRKGKYGEFEACSNYPKCKYIKKQAKKVTEIMPCPKCDGMIIEKRTKRGKIFYGCSNYPKCDFASWDKPVEGKCPECNSYLVEKNSKIKCSNCSYEKED